MRFASVGRLLKWPSGEWGGHQSLLEGTAVPLSLNILEVGVDLDKQASVLFAVYSIELQACEWEIGKDAVYWWKELHSFKIRGIYTSMIE